MMERLPEFIGNHPILSLLFVGLSAALVFTEVTRRLRRFTEVSPAQLTALINREDAAVFDVSANNEFESGHIVSARHLAASQVDPSAKPLAPLKDKPVAVYCRNGMSSEQVCAKLAKAGFTRVFWLKGGIQAWVGDQYPVARGKA